MKKQNLLLPLICLISILSCSKNDSDVEFTIQERIIKPVEPCYYSDLPKFPALSIHIIQREYSNKEVNRLKSSEYLTLNEYLEQRLIELYPELAYKGIMSAAKNEHDSIIKVYNKYLDELNFYYLQNGIDTIPRNDNYKEFTTLEEEIEYMNMTPEEVNKFLELEKYSKLAIPINRSILDSIININSSLKSGPLLVPILLGAAAITGYSAWRIIQSRNRAEQKASEYYPGKTDAGEIGDAYRHIFVSMHLSRYITEPGAWAVMNTYEILYPNDHPRDTYMDYHNNKVGRNTQYLLFRGSYLGDLNNWEKWANNVKVFVDNKNQNGVDMDWENTDPNKEKAKTEADGVDSKKYIFYLN